MIFVTQSIKPTVYVTASLVHCATSQSELNSHMCPRPEGNSTAVHVIVFAGRAIVARVSLLVLSNTVEAPSIGLGAPIKVVWGVIYIKMMRTRCN